MFYLSPDKVILAVLELVIIIIIIIVIYTFV